MITGKSKGLVKGDFVFTGAFPGIIISDVHTYAPCCEVFGFEQECGSAYAKDMRKLTKEDFLMLTEREGHHPPFRVYSKVSYDALKAAGIPVEKV
jgi:hypothetical protein